MKNLTLNQREILASIADDSDPDALEVIREYLALRAWSKAARLTASKATLAITSPFARATMIGRVASLTSPVKRYSL